MIVVRLQGGLGNQMFQYAAGRALAIRHQTELRLDTRSYRTDALRQYALDQLQIRAKPLSATATLALRARRRIADRCGIRGSTTFANERDCALYPGFEELPPDTCLDGHWQHEEYFVLIRDELRAELQPRAGFCANLTALLDRVRGGETVSVHIRGADYLDPREQTVHGALGAEYYTHAIDLLCQHVRAKLILYVFTDDEPAAKLVIPSGHNVVWLCRNEGRADATDLFLMSQCRHHIVANSSFSWWGAWLGEESGTLTIAPHQWYADPALNRHHPAPARWTRA